MLSAAVSGCTVTACSILLFVFIVTLAGTAVREIAKKTGDEKPHQLLIDAVREAHKVNRDIMQSLAVDSAVVLLDRFIHGCDLLANQIGSENGLAVRRQGQKPRQQGLTRTFLATSTVRCQTRNCCSCLTVMKL